MSILRKTKRRTRTTQLSSLEEEERSRLLEEVRRERVRRRIAKDFLAFLPYWQFLGSHGETLPFGDVETGDLSLWSGQQEFAELMLRERMIYALKAGKLGFTEIECAWDGYVLLFGPKNARVHLFSRVGLAANELLDRVRFGLTHLPDWLQLPVADEERGGDTGSSLKLKAGTDDVHRVIAYKTGPRVSIDASCHHAHVDEFSIMDHSETMLSSVLSTVVEGGTCHIVTRGAGEDTYAAEFWEGAENGSNGFYPFFQPWSARPDRDQRWYRQQQGKMPAHEFRYFAPSTPQDALSGDEQVEFVPIELWDGCAEDIPPLQPGSRETTIMAVDAGLRNDCAGIVLVTRHPERREDVAVRNVRLWQPERNKPVDLDEVESFIKAICLGGCAMGHFARHRRGRLEADFLNDPEPSYTKSCPACHPSGGGESKLIAPYPIYEVAYDEWQMAGSAQRLRKLGINMRAFGQQKDRTIADSELRDLIVNKRIAHNGNLKLREHIDNAQGVLDRREQKLRIEKKAPHRKVDLAVATSMGARRCLTLYL